MKKAKSSGPRMPVLKYLFGILDVLVLIAGLSFAAINFLFLEEGQSGTGMLIVGALNALTVGFGFVAKNSSSKIPGILAYASFTAHLAYAAHFSGIGESGVQSALVIGAIGLIGSIRRNSGAYAITAFLSMVWALLYYILATNIDFLYSRSDEIVMPDVNPLILLGGVVIIGGILGYFAMQLDAERKEAAKQAEKAAYRGV